MKPSGMEKATDRPEGGAQRDEDGAPKRRRGPGVSTLSIDRTEMLSVEAPAGSRHKGSEDIIVQDLMLKAETTRYRRERWETPDGERLIASLPAGIVGGCGPHLHCLVLMLHFQGQMTCERIVALLTGLGLAISKRQVVRLVTARPTSAPIGSPHSAPGPGNRAWLSCLVCSTAQPAMGSTRRRSPPCAALICRRTSSTSSPAMLRWRSAPTSNGWSPCARSASPISE